MRSLYSTLVGNKLIGRAEFWTLPPGELWWLIDAHLPQDAPEKDDQNARLLKLLEDALEEGET